MVNINRLSTAERARVVASLVEGNSIRATVRMTGVAKNTIVKLLGDLGSACSRYQDETIRNVRSRRVQCDEIWAFVGSKEKNTSPEKKAEGCGDCWTWTALDADTKLILSFRLGDRTLATAYDFMHDVAERISNRIQLTTDGHRVYLEAVESAFGLEIDYAMLNKVYRVNPEGQTRYSPAKCIGVSSNTISGDPDQRPNAVWSADFVFDRTAEGRVLKCLAMVDDATTEAVAIVPARALGGLAVTRVLDRLAGERGLR